MQTNMGSTDFGVVPHYLLNMLSALLEEAEEDRGLRRLSRSSGLRNAENLIKSKYAFALDTSKINELLYKLISKVSDFRHSSQQHRGAVTPTSAILKFKRHRFIQGTNSLLDELNKELEDVLNLQNAVSADPPAGDEDDDGGRDLSGDYVGLDPAAKEVEKFIVEGCEDDTSTTLKGIGIVGIGGSGKTTLARKVFWNLRNWFSPRIWVSLSGTLYDAPVSGNLRVKILRKMLVQAGCDVSELANTSVGNIPKLTEKLYRQLTGKRYLIVLDEVWHVNGWYGDLCSELPKGGASFGDCISHALPKDSGGRIIVTSRREHVAREMVGRENLCPIDTLLDKEIGWSVFSHAVHKDGIVDADHSTLSKMKEIISKQCGGLPLAARTFATIIPEQMQKKMAE